MATDFEELKKLDCREVARREGLEPNQQGKIRCFLHTGDSTPSLQLYENGWHCFGCGEHGDAVDLVARYRNIPISEAAERLRDSFGIHSTPAARKGNLRFEAEFFYRSCEGPDLKKVIRRATDTGKKDVKWWHKDTRVWKIGGKKLTPCLYDNGVESSGIIYVAEGEKCAARLGDLGVHAVTLPNGAQSTWADFYTPAFVDKAVIIVLDNDAPGRKYGTTVATNTYPVAKSVRVLDLSQIWPEIPEHGDIADMVAALGTDEASRRLAELVRQTPEWEPTPKGRSAKAAATFGEDNTTFLWYPYLPVGDYSVMMADGGTGKTILCCGIAAAVTTGKPLPGDEFGYTPQSVLIISAEDRGELLSKRLARSGADLDKVFILDCIDSEGMNFSDGYEEFTETVLRYHPALVIIDPWHAFLGANVDMNRVNAIRPVFQKLANLAKKCNCALLLISHVNKRAQGENSNNAATGSSDFINAARSAMRVIFDEGDEDCRIMVHTKTNYARYGQSVRYRIVDGGVQWEGFSDITRQTLESAARHRATPWEVMQKSEERESVNSALVEALEKSANQFTATRFSYDEFKKDHGDLIFGGMQPKRALDAVKDRLADDGYYLKTGIQVKKNGTKGNGFMVQRIETSEPEQMAI